MRTSCSIYSFHIFFSLAHVAAGVHNRMNGKGFGGAFHALIVLYDNHALFF